MLTLLQSYATRETVYDLLKNQWIELDPELGPTQSDIFVVGGRLERYYKLVTPISTSINIDFTTGWCYHAVLKGYTSYFEKKTYLFQLDLLCR